MTDTKPSETPETDAAECEIIPSADPQGSAYFVDPEARYTDRPSGKPRLVDRIRAEEAATG